MKLDVTIPACPAVLEALLEGMILVNLELMKRSELPPLYESGIRYKREQGTEDWQTCEQNYQLGTGDCEDLAAHRAAELRHTGEDEHATCVVRRGGRKMWHVLVGRGDGTIEDPSRVLGMGRH